MESAHEVRTFLVSYTMAEVQTVKLSIEFYSPHQQQEASLYGPEKSTGSSFLPLVTHNDNKVSLSLYVLFLLTQAQ